MSTIGTQLDAALAQVGAPGPQGLPGPVGPAGPQGVPGVPDPTLDARLTALENTVRGIVSLQIISEAFAGNAAQPAAASKLVITQQPTNVNSGSAFSPVVTVEVRDAGNVLVPTSTAVVNCTVSSGDVSWRLANNSHVNAVGGVATFTGMQAGGLTGPYTLTISSTGLTSAVSTSYTVTQVATKLGIRGQPDRAQTGVAMLDQPTVEVQDGMGVPMGTGTQTVTVAKNAGTATLSGGPLAVACVNGLATFAGLILTTPSTDTNLVFTAPSLTQAISGLVTVTAGAPTALLTEDFSSYANIATYTQQPRDPRSIYAMESDFRLDLMSFVSPGYGGLTQALRYNYPVAVNGAGDCDFTISRTLQLTPPTNSPGITEVWAEAFVRFSSTWTFNDAGFCGTAGAYKLFFFDTFGNPRFELVFADYGWIWETAPATVQGSATGALSIVYTTPLLNTIVNGNQPWTRIRMYGKLSSASGVADGQFKVWVNDTLVRSSPNIVCSAPSESGNMYGVSMGANLNKLQSHTQWVDWGRVILYSTDPGWV